MTAMYTPEIRWTEKKEFRQATFVLNSKRHILFQVEKTTGRQFQAYCSNACIADCTTVLSLSVKDAEDFVLSNCALRFILTALNTVPKTVALPLPPLLVVLPPLSIDRMVEEPEPPDFMRIVANLARFQMSAGCSLVD
uniref:Uncharacterized protein n=1 Tax=Romanomermis culicivorax TaxID=13658 RepID=A0A915IWT6_ROMCU